MSSISHFESRPGKVSCSAEKVFLFVSDLRNFGQFIPDGTINNWKASREECSFSVSVLGTVTVRLKEKEEYSKIVFNGDALKKEDFELTLHINNVEEEHAGVHVTLNAELNPMMKMMAVKPIGQFLQMLVTEMEKFTGWENVSE